MGYHSGGLLSSAPESIHVRLLHCKTIFKIQPEVQKVDYGWFLSWFYILKLEA